MLFPDVPNDVVDEIYKYYMPRLFPTQRGTIRLSMVVESHYGKRSKFSEWLTRKPPRRGESSSIPRERRSAKY